MKYIKKSQVVEAFKWTGDKEQTEDPVWIIEAIKNKVVFFINQGTEDVEMIISLPHSGLMTAYRGDYILKDAQGNITRKNPEEFQELYMKVGEDSEI
mgnify:CR=1 FL=1|jgi:hypothetical protein